MFDRRTDSLEFQRPPGFPDPEAGLAAQFGKDLLLDPLTKDLTISQSGDLKLVGGVAVVSQSLVRRLGTYRGGYERYLRSLDGVESTGDALDNETTRYLSSLITQSDLSELTLEFERIAASDGRLQVVGVEPVQRGGNQLELDLRYRLSGRIGETTVTL